LACGPRPILVEHDITDETLILCDYFRVVERLDG
jgi:hypothetical protein